MEARSRRVWLGWIRGSEDCLVFTVAHFPKELLEKVATLHLPVLGAVHTVFSEEHADYTGVKVEGPLKSGHYRYLLFSFSTTGWRSLVC